MGQVEVIEWSPAEHVLYTTELSALNQGLCMFNFPGPRHLAALLYNSPQGQHQEELEGN